MRVDKDHAHPSKVIASSQYQSVINITMYNKSNLPTSSQKKEKKIAQQQSDF